jgi:hypothetical protein
MILIQKMHSSGVFRFDDNINDMDFFSRFKFTNKGPHSAGQKNGNSVGVKYRGMVECSCKTLLIAGNSR